MKDHYRRHTSVRRTTLTATVLHLGQDWWLQCVGVSPLLPPLSPQSESLGCLGVGTGTTEPAHTSNQRSKVSMCWCTWLIWPQFCSMFAPGLAPVALACSKTSIPVHCVSTTWPYDLGMKEQLFEYTHTGRYMTSNQLQETAIVVLKSFDYSN